MIKQEDRTKIMRKLRREDYLDTKGISTKIHRDKTKYTRKTKHQVLSTKYTK